MELEEDNNFKNLRFSKMSKEIEEMYNSISICLLV